jgi:hypothetical protein
MNKEMLTNVQAADNPVKMITNAGSKVITKQAEVLGFGTVYYNSTIFGNIFEFSAMADKYRIVYDSAVEDAFLVHTENRVIKFERTSEGLYAYQPHRSFYDEVVIAEAAAKAKSFLLSTVSENKEGYSRRQFEDAKVARRLYHAVGCPTVENFKFIFRQDIIKNYPVTVADVDATEEIFGQDIGSLKSKSTRKKPPRVKGDYVEVPQELKAKNTDLVFCMDIM